MDGTPSAYHPDSISYNSGVGTGELGGLKLTRPHMERSPLSMSQQTQSSFQRNTAWRSDTTTHDQNRPAALNVNTRQTAVSWDNPQVTPRGDFG